MARWFTKVAAAAGLIAAVAAPLTQGARAGTLPLSTTAPTSTVTNTVGSTTQTVTSTTQTVTSTTQTITSAVQPVTSTVQSTTAPVTSALPSSPAAPAPTSPTVTSTGGTLAAPLSPSSTSTTNSDPSDPPAQAPPGSASADALSVPLLDTCVSCTSASAGPGSSSSNATALRILGHDLAGGDSNGSSEIDLLPANPLLSVALAQWMASSSQNGDGSTSSSSSSKLIHVTVTNPQDGSSIADLAILQASSSAFWSQGKSSGDGSTDGVDLNLGNGQLVIIVLHTESHSSATGQTAHTYVASVNGNEILSNTQVGQPIVITVPGLITISLLTTGSGSCSAGGAVATVTNLLGMSGEQLGAFEVHTTGCAAPGSNNGGGNNGGGNNGGGNNGGSNNGGTPGTSGSSGNASGVQAASTSGATGAVSTPTTGVTLGLLGFLLVGAGVAAAATSRIRRRAK